METSVSIGISPFASRFFALRWQFKLKTADEVDRTIAAAGCDVSAHAAIGDVDYAGDQGRVRPRCA